MEGNVGKNNVSVIFSFRAVGQLVGAILCAYLFPKLGSGRWKVVSLGVVLIVDAIGLGAIPIVRDLWLLGLIFMITAAFSGGWLVTGVNSMILNVWGRTRSKPIVASNQFAFSIGSILAPFLVGLYMPERESYI